MTRSDFLADLHELIGRELSAHEEGESFLKPQEIHDLLCLLEQVDRDMADEEEAHAAA